MVIRVFYKVNVITEYGVMEGLAWYGSETVPPTIFVGDNSWIIYGSSCSYNE